MFYKKIKYDKIIFNKGKKAYKKFFKNIVLVQKKTIFLKKLIYKGMLILEL